MVSASSLTHHQFLHSAPKVHAGFHAAWDESGLKAAVTELIKLKISVENAQHINVFLTGTCLPVCPVCSSRISVAV